MNNLTNLTTTATTTATPTTQTTTTHPALENTNFYQMDYLWKDNLLDEATGEVKDLLELVTHYDGDFYVACCELADDRNYGINKEEAINFIKTEWGYLDDFLDESKECLDFNSMTFHGMLEMMIFKKERKDLEKLEDDVFRYFLFSLFPSSKMPVIIYDYLLEYAEKYAPDFTLDWDSDDLTEIREIHEAIQEAEKNLFTYKKLKDKQQAEVNKFPMKFSFSDKQFKKDLESLGLTLDNYKDKISIVGYGGFMLKTEKVKLDKLLIQHKRELQEAIEQDPTGENFIFGMFNYELFNHEYAVSFSYSNTLEALGYTREKIRANHKLETGFRLALKFQERWAEKNGFL